MPSFLEKVSDYIYQAYGTQTEALCIVLPNRRGGLFLKKKLAQRYNQAIWSPSIFSIEDFIWEFSGYEKADLAEQLFIFYSIYCKTEGEKAEPFEAFCKWAPTLLADFSEADASLADTENLFGNLSDIRAIENWSLGQVTLTDFQKQYLHFWSRMAEWYRLYRQTITNAGKAYSGLAYRTVAEKINKPEIQQRWKKIIFAGLNALSPAEERIISVLHKSGRADVLWDADRYYLEDPVQEAGRFLRRYRDTLFTPSENSKTDFQHVEDCFATEAKEFTIAGVARSVSQAKAASHFLETIPIEKRYSPETVIVLADDQLLLPLLHALPPDAAPVNITMGFPLRNTPVSTLVNSLFMLHENANRFSIRSREGEVKYYHSDIVRLLRHPYLRQLSAGLPLVETIEKYINRFNVIFCSPAQLRKAAGDELADAFSLFEQVLTPWTNTNEALNGLKQLIQLLRAHFIPEEKENYRIENEYLFQLSLLVNRAENLHQQWNITTELPALRALISQQLASTTLPFYGEPVAGLQIMGLLETRTLDFENVILLSANENMLPAGKMQSTFIIYELRKAFGLPVWQDRDAIAAYNFYRLIQRAKNIFLIHNTDQDVFGTKEKSRFITQLQHELPVLNKRVKIEDTVFDAGIPLTPDIPEPILVPKSEKVMEQLTKLANDGLSPSLLNSYRNCSLQFYFHYVAGLREADEVEETIDSRTLGVIIHQSLEEIFKPAIGTQIDSPFFDAAIKKIEHICDAVFAKNYPLGEISSGKNLLARKIAVRYIKNYLQQEKKESANLKLTVEALETNLKFQLDLHGRSITLIGQADRIDKTDRYVRLVDYKTGKTETKELRVTDWAEIETKPEIHKSFQLLMYAWLYARMTNEVMPIQSGIVSFRKIKEGLMTVSTPEGNLLQSQTLADFEQALIRLVNQIYNDQIPFAQTEDLNNCRLCTFNSICRREA
jgi:ATP-dependent helicase/nuclease subunit B